MMSGDVGSAEALKAAVRQRHDSRMVAPQPKGGGAVPRIPVVNVQATRAARRPERTMHETEVAMQAGRATVRRKSALDECRVLLLALIAFTIPSPIMKPPKDLTYESSPSGVITSGSRRSGMLRLIGRWQACSRQTTAVLTP